MRDKYKTKQQLIDELVELRQQVSELEPLTNRHEQRQRLWGSDDQYRTLIENADEPIFITQGAHIILSNSHTSALLGYSSEELATIPVMDLIWPEDREITIDRTMKALGGEIPSPSVSIRFMNKACEAIWVQMTSMIITYEEKVGFLHFLSDLGSQKKAEQEIKKLSFIVESMSDGVIISDLHGTITYVNRGVTEQLGYGRDELIGKTLEAFFSENDPPGFADLIQDVISGRGLSKSTEYMAKHKNGKEIPFGIRFSVLNDPEGEPNQIIAVSRDISEIRQAEEELRKERDRARNYLDTAGALIMVLNARGDVTLINKRGCEILGYEQDEIIGKDCVDNFLPERTRGRIRRQFRRLIDSGIEDWHGENPILIKENQERDLVWRNRLLYDETKEYVGVITSGVDITERVQAEEALRESEKKYRLLVENANDGIFIVQDGVAKFSNHRTLEALGYSAKELAGIPFADLVHPEDRDMVLERDLKGLRGEKLPGTYSFRIFNRSCRELWVELNTVLITWEGRPATLNFLRDVTEKKRLETQFQQAQKIEALGTLAGGIAHDFNNLLMAIQGNASLMLFKKDPNDPECVRLKNIEQYVQKGAELTKQLLGFGRGGKFEVKPIDLNDLLKKSSEMFARTKKEISIHPKHPEGIWSVEADQGQIEQLLMNLYINAWQAMPGGGKLFLETENVELALDYVKPYGVDPGKYVKVSVTDTGVGMDRKTRARIFDPFFTTKEVGIGTGLGLASAYGIIKNHGGIIDVSTKKGEGSTFDVYLPASEKEAPREKELREEILGGKETIFLVDDEDMIIDTGREMLEEMGYTVLPAKSGMEAIDIYRERGDQISMVILDMIMPQMGGGDTYDRLKELDPQVKVLLSSGYSLDDQAAEILGRGYSGFIQKPFDMKEISHKIRGILDNQ